MLDFGDAMPEWDHPNEPSAEDENAAPVKSPEDAADRLGLKAALFVLGVGFFLAALWVVNSPSFAKCSAVQSVSDRVACYDELRQELFKPPAKGGELPNYQQ